MIVNMKDIPFATTAWSAPPATEHRGERGKALCKTPHSSEVRVKMAGYLADHWCTKGQTLLCLSGELHIELDDGRRFTLTAGMSWQVADDAKAHCSRTDSGTFCSLLTERYF
ncbi:hypothetical protein ETR_11868 [Erwinia tracheiphila PSU-1]|nr:hypothetical protein ETR_11868 [Erwinia tracheiphila PSU-1]